MRKKIPSYYNHRFPRHFDNHPAKIPHLLHLPDLQKIVDGLWAGHQLKI